MTPRRRRQAPLRGRFDLETADRLHSAAIHLLRSLRAEDRAAGLSGPKLSALSVIVFAGPISMSALAAAEQVRPPSMTRLIGDLERAGLAERTQDEADRRVQQVRATDRGRRLLLEGRDRRVGRLALALRELSAEERRLLARAATILDRLSRHRT